MDKSVIVGAVEFSTVHEKTEEKSQPAMCQVLGTQILIPAVDPTGSHELVPALLSHGLRAPRKYYLR